MRWSKEYKIKMVEKQLSDMRVGENGKTARIEGSGALRQRIMDMGIVGVRK